MKKSFFFAVEVAFSISFYYYSLICWYLTFQNISFFCLHTGSELFPPASLCAITVWSDIIFLVWGPKVENIHQRKVNVQCKTIWAINSPSTFFFSNPFQNAIHSWFYHSENRSPRLLLQIFFIWLGLFLIKQTLKFSARS